MTTSKTTTDHEVIRRWIEERGGRPSVVESTADDGKSGGLLRVEFRDEDDNLEEIDWEQFFAIFDENDLAFLYQEKTKDGETSRFNKFVERNQG